MTTFALKLLCFLMLLLGADADCDQSCPAGHYAAASTCACTKCEGGRSLIFAASRETVERRARDGSSTRDARDSSRWANDVGVRSECTSCNDDVRGYRNEAWAGEGYYVDRVQGGTNELSDCEKNCAPGYMGKWCDAEACPDVHPLSSLGAMILMANPSSGQALGGSASDDVVSLKAMVRNALKEREPGAPSAPVGLQRRRAAPRVGGPRRIPTPH